MVENKTLQLYLFISKKAYSTVLLSIIVYLSWFWLLWTIKKLGRQTWWDNPWPGRREASGTKTLKIEWNHGTSSFIETGKKYPCLSGCFFCFMLGNVDDIGICEHWFINIPISSTFPNISMIPMSSTFPNIGINGGHRWGLLGFGQCAPCGRRVWSSRPSGRGEGMGQGQGKDAAFFRVFNMGH